MCDCLALETDLPLQEKRLFTGIGVGMPDMRVQSLAYLGLETSVSPSHLGHPSEGPDIWMWSDLSKCMP